MSACYLLKINSNFRGGFKPIQAFSAPTDRIYITFPCSRCRSYMNAHRIIAGTFCCVVFPALLFQSQLKFQFSTHLNFLDFLCLMSAWYSSITFQFSISKATYIENYWSLVFSDQLIFFYLNNFIELQKLIPTL